MFKFKPEIEKKWKSVCLVCPIETLFLFINT